LGFLFCADFALVSLDEEAGVTWTRKGGGPSLASEGTGYSLIGYHRGEGVIKRCL
jgi:hypothetical protein